MVRVDLIVANIKLIVMTEDAPFIVRDGLSGQPTITDKVN